MAESLTVQATRDPRVYTTEAGERLTLPAGWVVLPPGDAGLTRRVKASTATWTIEEKRGRKVFGRGVAADAAVIERHRATLASEREDPSYARKLEQGRARREREQVAYVEDFTGAILDFLRFAPAWTAHSEKMARAVAAHATPVGSGTVARTERIPIEERASAAVIAWMRHQTTAYDDMSIPRVAGLRREVRRELAARSRKMLDLHRRPEPHAAAGCALCTALAAAPTPSGGPAEPPKVAAAPVAWTPSASSRPAERRPEASPQPGPATRPVGPAPAGSTAARGSFTRPAPPAPPTGKPKGSWTR